MTPEQEIELLQLEQEKRRRTTASSVAFETHLNPAEELKFQSWKKQYAPNDSGTDYDLRGAYKSGLKPSPENGHWPDTYKKPNHPTFSVESIYAKDAISKAGRWDGETYIPPGSSTKKIISDIARPILEVGGAVGGGAIGVGLGGPVAPLTTAGGGALGFAGGKSVADALDEFMGLKQAPQNIVEAGKRIPENILTGAKFEALSLAMHPVVKGLVKVTEPAVKGLVKGAGFVGKKIAAPLFGVSDEALNAYLANPSTIKDAGMEKLAENLPKVADKFKDVIKFFSKEADSLLSKSKFIQPSATDAGGAITRDEVNQVIKSARTKIGGLYGADAKAAAKTLADVSNDLKKLGPTASQNQIRGIVNKLDDNINWNRFWKSPELMSSSENSLVKVRSGLDDLIKTKNIKYAEAMKPVDEAITARGQFLKQFGIDKVKGGGYVPKDLTTSRLANSLKEGKLATRRIAEQTKKITGDDILKEVQNAKYNQEFFGERTSRPMTLDLLTMLGAGAGGTLGGFGAGASGALIGKTAGMGIEKYGGKAGSKILDILSKVDSRAIPIDVLKDPLVRRLLASQGVGLTGNSSTQIQDLLNMVGARSFDHSR